MKKSQKGVICLFACLFDGIRIRFQKEVKSIFQLFEDGVIKGPLAVVGSTLQQNFPIAEP